VDADVLGDVGADLGGALGRYAEFSNLDGDLVGEVGEDFRVGGFFGFFVGHAAASGVM
jgi:hypothetical protein